MQQMQVTVPDGVGPGMPFIVDTPAGQMQVICPVDATAGGPMIVNVPVQAVVAQAVLPMAAVVEAVPQAAANVPVQAVVAQAVVPMAAVVEAVPQAAVVQAVAPQSIMMSRGQMDGRVEEIQSGCYTLSDCLCCYWAYYKVDARAGTVTYGPCCCIFMGCCPVVIPDEIKTAVAPGLLTSGTGTVARMFIGRHLRACASTTHNTTRPVAPPCTSAASRGGLHRIPSE